MQRENMQIQKCHSQEPNKELARCASKILTATPPCGSANQQTGKAIETVIWLIIILNTVIFIGDGRVKLKLSGVGRALTLQSISTD